MAVPVEEDEHYYSIYTKMHQQHAASLFYPGVRHQEWFRESYDPTHMVRHRALVLDEGQKAARRLLRLLSEEGSGDSKEGGEEEEEGGGGTEEREGHEEEDDEEEDDEEEEGEGGRRTKVKGGKPKVGSMYPGFCLSDTLPSRRLSAGLEDRRTPPRLIHIHNLHPSLHRQRLHSHLSSLSGFISLELSNATRTGKRSSYSRSAWALFSSPSAAAKAVKDLEGRNVELVRMDEGFNHLGRARREQEKRLREERKKAEKGKEGGEDGGDKEREGEEQDKEKEGEDGWKLDPSEFKSEKDERNVDRSVLGLSWAAPPPPLSPSTSVRLRVSLEEGKKRPTLLPVASSRLRVEKDLRQAQDLAKLLDQEAEALASRLPVEVAGSEERWMFRRGEEGSVSQVEVEEAGGDSYGYDGGVAATRWVWGGGKKVVRVEDVTSHPVFSTLSDSEKLDVLLHYLRAAHNYDYYAGFQGSEAGDVRYVVGEMYRRTPPPRPLRRGGGGKGGGGEEGGKEDGEREGGEEEEEENSIPPPLSHEEIVWCGFVDRCTEARTSLARQRIQVCEGESVAEAKKKEEERRKEEEKKEKEEEKRSEGGESAEGRENEEGEEGEEERERETEEGEEQEKKETSESLRQNDKVSLWFINSTFFL